MNPDYSGSEQLRLRRVIDAQGFDARNFRSGRILRLLVREIGVSSFVYKQLFLANLSGLSVEDAYSAAGVPDSYVLSHEIFEAPELLGPALISRRHVAVSATDPSALIARSAIKDLLVVPDEAAEMVVYPGPFSNVVQEAAAQIGPFLKGGLFGGRAMWDEGGEVMEECYSIMAKSRDQAASTLARSVRAWHPKSALKGITFEVEDTHFDRPYYGNALLILKQRSKLQLREYCAEQGLPAPMVPADSLQERGIWRAIGS
ncbi:hypothetical protein [Microbacterium sp. NPDC057944]|uniref:hypothetical protein n=1 Tax=Microbacterium sp. NPDC057944 TaxID=3346286 RepID=UPI0036D7F703